MVEPVYPANSPYVLMSHRTYCWDMMQTLDKTRRGNLLSDVTLNVEGQTFAAHRCMRLGRQKQVLSQHIDKRHERKADDDR